MAWPGVNLALQWAACTVILAWAAWFLATRLFTEFRPGAEKTNCPGCSCRNGDELDGAALQDRQGGESHSAPAAKLKSG